MKLKRPDLSRDWRMMPNRKKALKQIETLRIMDDGRRTVKSLAKHFKVSEDEIEYHKERILIHKLGRAGGPHELFDLNNYHYRGLLLEKQR